MLVSIKDFAHLTRKLLQLPQRRRMDRIEGGRSLVRMRWSHVGEELGGRIARRRSCER